MHLHLIPLKYWSPRREICYIFSWPNLLPSSLSSSFKGEMPWQRLMPSYVPPVIPLLPFLMALLSWLSPLLHYYSVSMDNCHKCGNPFQNSSCLNIASLSPHPFLATLPFLYLTTLKFWNNFLQIIFLLPHLPVISHIHWLKVCPHQAIQVSLVSITSITPLLIQMSAFQ